MFQSINPTTNTVVQQYPVLTGDEIQARLASAQEGYVYWRNMSIEERGKYIYAIGRLLKERTEKLARLAVLEMGKPIRQAISEIEKCAWLCQYVAEHAAPYLQEEIVEINATKSYIRYDPLGAVLGIMPWNYPYWQALRFGIPALIAGNVVLLKPAPNVPQCSLALADIFTEVTERTDVFQTLFAKIEDIAAIIAHPLVQGIALTGSDRAGAAVAALAGKHIKKCVLELGGSDAFIVLQDADIEHAAKIAVQTRINNCGQVCLASKRWIVEAPVADAFRKAVIKHMQAVKIGYPIDEGTEMSCLARPDLLENLQRQVAESVEKGATVTLDGGPIEHAGNYFRPMILENIQPGMPAYDEELFGPVGVMMVVKDEAEAITLANDTAYGLGTSIWSKDIAKAETIASQIEAGAIAINTIVASDPRLPFGGIKRSGFGRELAGEGLRAFVNVKSVVVG